MNVEELGRRVRLRRKGVSLRQQELAALAGVGTRFIGELEKGKETLEIGRVLRVLETLGLELDVHERHQRAAGTHAGA
ncbi:MAG: helix-turn-helix transcriptional regulator [Gammaproteobacteria bacterium]|nr:helix-turn-helix transcriptional regulator [Gammaproteobacteria bacterium]